MEPTFVKSSATYETYTDFWRLVRLSGFRVLPAREADWSKKGIYIWPTMDEEFMQVMDSFPKGKRAAKLIFWNLERPDGSYRGKMNIQELFWKGTGEILEWADAVWVSDKGLESIDPRNVFAVLGGHPGLREQPPVEISWELLHLGQSTPRRQAVLTKVRELGISVVEGAWGPQRERMLASSRLFVSIDRVFGIHISSPLRYVLAAAYGLPILSEEVEDPYPLEPAKTILMAKYENLPNAVHAALRMPMMKDVLAEVGEACRKLLCEEWTFRRGVMEAIQRSF